MEVVVLLFLQPVGRTNEGSRAEVGGEHRLFGKVEAALRAVFVVLLSGTGITELNHSVYG